jgi:uncharacterized protein YndB with AHSA1/START domain
MEKRNATASADTEVLISYMLNAPRELVFRAWTDPEHLPRWYAPRGCSVVFKQLDIRVGGSFRCCISNPEYGDCWSRGMYYEIIAPEKLVYNLVITNERGEPVDPVAVGMDADWPAETLVTVTFAELEGKTRITLHQTVSESVARRTGAHPSWIQMFERFEEELQKLNI